MAEAHLIPCSICGKHFKGKKGKSNKSCSIACYRIAQRSGQYARGPMPTTARHYGVYDLTTNEVVTTIETDEGTENLLVASNKFFAANYNYGSSSTVSVINPTTNTLIDEIELSAGPAGMIADANGKVWVVCTGAYGAENGYLYRINPASLEIKETITITGAPGADIAVTPDGQSIIYSVGNSIYKVGISATEEPAEALIQATDVVYLYGLNVDPSNGKFIWRMHHHLPLPE